MAFVNLAVFNTAPHAAHSALKPCSSNLPNVFVNGNLGLSQKRSSRRHFIYSNTKAQQESNNTATQRERTNIISPLAEVRSTENLFQTPVYRPSFLVTLYDLFRQTIRNVEIGRVHGPVYKTNNLFGSLTMVTDHDAIVEMSRKPYLFSSSGAFPLQFVNLLGYGAFLFADGTRHATSRGRVSHALLPSITPTFHNTIVHQARKFFRSLEAETSATTNPVSMINPAKQYFLDLVIKIAINEEQHLRKQVFDNNNNYELAAKKLSSAFIEYADGFVSPTFLPAYQRAKQARDVLDKELNKLFLRRLQDKNTRAKLRLVRNRLLNDKIANVLRVAHADLMSILIATSSLELPECDEDTIYTEQKELKEIRSLSDTLRLLWVAGDATQTSAFLCVIMEIFSDAVLLKRLIDEQRRIPELTAHTVTHNMHLLSSVLTESMRINPAVQMMFRRTTEDVIVLNHLIPKETVVGLDYSSANMDGFIFRNPDEFIPDRFVGNLELARKVLLFGAIGSVHYCVGASLATTILKTTLAVMLREFDVDIKPWKTRSVRHILDSVPQDGVWIYSCRQKRS